MRINHSTSPLFCRLKRGDSVPKRNPNGYGCVTKLKGDRSRPWVVRVTIYDQDGHGRQVPLDYAETEEQANIILAEYNNNPWDIGREKVTLAILYKQWETVKLPKLGISTQGSLKSAYKHCSKLYGMKYRKIRSFQMQDCIDNCGCGYSTQWAIKNLFGHLDRFAFELDVIEKMYSQLTTAPTIPETSKKPFTDKEIEALWKLQKEPWVDSVLIFLYTGFRLNELLMMKTEAVNLIEETFQGGEKTTSGKNRIVPIHPRILHFAKARVEEGNEYFFSKNGKKLTQSDYYSLWNGVMQMIETKHTPHECRHTFRSHLDSANGNQKCIDMLMGHKSKDVGQRVYTHKTIKELKETILLLK